MDDITQPFGGVPQTGRMQARDRTPMTVDELARRVFQAEQRLMKVDGRHIAEGEVVLSPDNYADIVTSDEGRTKGWVEFDPATCRHKFRGHRLRIDRDLADGQVRLRSEVVA